MNHKKRNEALSREKAEAALRSLSRNGQDTTTTNDPTRQAVTSYRSLSELPSDALPSQIVVHPAHDTVLFPIDSQLVPFHISTIKNVLKADEAGFLVLTVEFVTPTAKRAPAGSAPEHSFIRSLQYRTRGDSLVAIFENIRKLQSEYKAKIKSLQSTLSIVDQPQLTMIRNPTASLNEVMCKPSIHLGKVSHKGRHGVLTAHQNGFKYIVGNQGSGATFVDIIYSNIKSCFFQRADKQDTLVMFHFELHHPIYIKNDKTTTYMQFYVELQEDTRDVSSKDAGYEDENQAYIEEQEEQRQRQQRKHHNQRFATFAGAVESQWAANNPEVDYEFEIPNAKQKFLGVIGRDLCDIYPSDNFLVALQSNPPFVVNMNDLECASLERVGFGLREFDLVLINKDFKQDVRIVNNIAMNKLEQLRTFLYDHKVIALESSLNINWKVVLDDIKTDPQAFYQDGGWAIYFLDEEDEDEQDDDEESAFEDEDAEEDDGSADDFTSDSESEDDDGSGSGDESGVDWSASDEE